ncbi:YCF48-related protein [Massilia sp. R2A-15]|uniref:YCF48-related protein n=1 Tax=Massilia sp. R2A-15 TaxID=3064278 RepID=UPI0027340F9F|nr:YCF48-related protein [Massilia sp. R2A-15]WLI87832.1 YCF48-related protein [Massilia sp. R2A-15]
MWRYYFLAFLGLIIACTIAQASDRPYAATLNAHTAKYRYNGYFGSLVRMRVLPDGNLLAIDGSGMLIKGGGDPTTWERSWGSGIDGNDFAVSKDGKHLWLAGNEGKLIYSHDGGEHWETKETGTSENLLTIEVSSDGGTLWIAGNKGVLRRSNDGGNHWETINSGSTQERINAIFLTPNGRHIVVSGSNGFIAIGETSARVLSKQNHCTYQNLKRIAATPDATKIVIVGTDGTICTSIDLGEHWSPAVLSSYETQSLWDVAYYPKSDSFIAVGEKGAIFLLQGAIWKYQSPEWLSDTLNNVVVAGKDQKLVAAGGGGVIISSRDSGKTWTNIDDKAVPHESFVEVSGSDDGTVIVAAGSDNQVSMSQDGGKHFTTTTVGVSPLKSVTMSGNGQTAYLGSSAGVVFRWTAATSNWERIASTVSSSITAMHTNRDGKLLLVTTEEGTIWRMGVDAPTLHLVHPAESGMGLYALAADPAGERFLAVGAQGRALISLDSGSTWMPNNIDTPNNLLSVAWDSDGVLWTGTSNGAIYTASKIGAPWNYAGAVSGSADSMAVMDGILWIGADRKILASYDRFLSRAQIKEFKGTAQTMFAATTTHSLWVATVDHELGMFSPDGSKYPNLVNFSVPQVLSPRMTNSLVLTFKNSRLCSTNDIKFKGWIGPESSAVEEINLNKTLVSNDTVRLSFVPPGDLPGLNITIRIAAVCGTDFIYMYSFYGRALISWIDRIPGGYGTVVGFLTAILLPALSLVLYALRPAALLQLQAIISTESVPTIFRPVASFVGHYLLTGFLCKRPRVLAAWVALRETGFREVWNRHPLTIDHQAYIPLPLEVLDGSGSTDCVDYPAGALLAPHFTIAPIVVQIVGVAGIGKTTFAWALGQWMLDTTLLRRTAFPIPLSANGTAPPAQAFELALQQFFGKLAPRGELQGNLLDRGYLVPIVDRLSERDSGYQQQVEEWGSGIGVLVTTTRRPSRLPGNSLQIRPMPITSVSVLSRYIENEMSRRQGGGLAKSMLGTADIVSVLVHSIVGSPTPTMETNIAGSITPLLASTFTALAVELLEAGASLDSLPRSTAQVYLTYLRRMIRPAFPELSSQKILCACSELAQHCLRDSSGPRPVALELAVTVIDRLLGDGSGEPLIEHLVVTGIIRMQERIGTQSIIFVIDSYAEVLAAYFIVSNGTEGAILEAALRLRVDNDAVGTLSLSQTLGYVEEFRRASIV